MKRSITLFLFALFLAPHAHATQGDSVYATTLDVGTPVTTINAQCATPLTAGCSGTPGSAVVLKLNGRNSVSAQIVTANFTGTFTPYASLDCTSNWTPTALRTSIGTTGGAASTSALAASTATLQYTIFLPYGGAGCVMLASTAAVTNSATVRLTASNTIANLLELLVTSKGTSPLNGIVLGTQDLKESGRTYVALSADGVTPAVSETLITFTKTVADTQTTGQTSYTITNAKTFRLQAVCASATMGAAANRVRVALRLNTGGACIASSNILLPVVELAPNYGTATAAEGGANGCVTIPDGLEIAGNGTKAICLSEAATAASGTLTVNLVGFEY